MATMSTAEKKKSLSSGGGGKNSAKRMMRLLQAASNNSASPSGPPPLLSTAKTPPPRHPSSRSAVKSRRGSSSSTNKNMTLQSSFLASSSPLAKRIRQQILQSGDHTDSRSSDGSSTTSPSSSDEEKKTRSGYGAARTRSPVFSTPDPELKSRKNGESRSLSARREKLKSTGRFQRALQSPAPPSSANSGNESPHSETGHTDLGSSNGSTPALLRTQKRYSYDTPLACTSTSAGSKSSLVGRTTPPLTLERAQKRNRFSYSKLTTPDARSYKTSSLPPRLSCTPQKQGTSNRHTSRQDASSTVTPLPHRRASICSDERNGGHDKVETRRNLDKRTARLLHAEGFVQEIARRCQDQLDKGCRSAPPRISKQTLHQQKTGVSVSVRKRPLFSPERDRGDFDVVAVTGQQQNRGDSRSSICVYKTLLESDMRTPTVQPVTLENCVAFDETTTTEELYRQQIRPFVQMSSSGHHGGEAPEPVTILMFGTR